jgi:hypothetical protein
MKIRVIFGKNDLLDARYKRNVKDCPFSHSPACFGDAFKCAVF